MNVLNKNILTMAIATVVTSGAVGILGSAFSNANANESAATKDIQKTSSASETPVSGDVANNVVDKQLEKIEVAKETKQVSTDTKPNVPKAQETSTGNKEESKVVASTAKVNASANTKSFPKVPPSPFSTSANKTEKQQAKAEGATQHPPLGVLDDVAADEAIATKKAPVAPTPPKRPTPINNISSEAVAVKALSTAPQPNASPKAPDAPKNDLNAPVAPTANVQAVPIKVPATPEQPAKPISAPTDSGKTNFIPIPQMPVAPKMPVMVPNMQMQPHRPLMNTHDMPKQMAVPPFPMPPMQIPVQQSGAPTAPSAQAK